MTGPREPVLLLGLSAWAGGGAAWWLWAAGHIGWLAVAGALLAAVVVIGMRRPQCRVAAVLLVCGLAIGASATATHLSATRPPVLRDLAGETVTAQARIGSASVSHPREIGSAPTVRASAVLSQVSVGGRVAVVAAPVVLIGDAAALGRPQRGEVLTVTGRLLPERPLREPGLTIAVTEVSAVVPASGWPAMVNRMRSALWRVLDPLDQDAASLIAGLAIGDDSRQRAALAEAMRDSGLSHLTAVSGGNIAIVAGLVVGLVAAVGGSLTARIGAGITAVVGYAGFVGPEPSVLRAGVMGVVALFGVLRGARGGGYPLLGLAVLGLVVCRPGLVVSWGFALSVAATGGILSLAPLLERRWPGGSVVARGVAAAVAVTVGAQIATAPLLAAMTGQLPLAAVPANLAAAPLVAPITVLGLFLTMVASISEPVGRWAAVLAEPFGMLLAELAGWGASQSWATVETPTGVAGGLLVSAAGVVIGVAAIRMGLRRGLAVASAVLVLALCLARPPPVPDGWVAAACDVGQGDAFVVRVGAGAGVLIDTGPGIEELVACLERLQIGAVPLLLLTHFDTDHVAAAAAVLARFGTRTVLVSPVSEPAGNAAAVRALAADAGVRLLEARPGMRLRVGQAALTVVWPQRVIRVGSVSNNSAVVTQVVVGGAKLLFTGDLEPPAQAALMAAHPGGDFTVTTIPHHGSAAQDPRFLQWTGAPLAWVSAGEGNRFGHPTPRALRLAAAAGQTVGRTDRQGTLVLVPGDGRPRIVALGSRGRRGRRVSDPVT
jgi:competence protein ComEC